jgi:single-strand DNA-binding protein
MNNLVNNVRLCGNIGTAPEVKTFADNKKVVRLNLATSETYKDSKGEKQTLTTWHNISCWNNNAIFAEKYVSKGDTLLIDGKLRHRVYTDKDGVKRSAWEIECNEIHIVKKAQVKTEQAPTPQGPAYTPNEAPSHYQDLPF